MKQSGGLKLILKDELNNGFNPIFDMLNHPETIIKLLTYKSLVGFMIEISVTDEASRYLTLGAGNKFNKVVNNFILKIVVLSQTRDLPHYNGNQKQTETKFDFFYEAQMQQNIWKKTILGGKEPLCPSIANFSIFSNNESKNFLTFFKNKTTDIETIKVFEYLINLIFNPSKLFEIGVIVMPKVNKSYTPYQAFKSETMTVKRENNIYANMIAQMVRLFLEVGAIHFDLHLNNYLLYIENKTLKCLIIDFGRVSNIFDDNDDIYLKKEDKLQLRNVRSHFLDNLIGIGHNTRESYQLDEDLVISLIVDKINQFYNIPWINDLPLLSDKKHIYIKAFDIITKALSTSQLEHLQMETIKRYEKEGRFIDFSQDVDKFEVLFPTLKCTDDNSRNCSIMGGKKFKKFNSKKTRKHKSKKYKYYTRKHNTK